MGHPDSDRMRSSGVLQGRVGGGARGGYLGSPSGQPRKEILPCCPCRPEQSHPPLAPVPSTSRPTLPAAGGLRCSRYSATRREGGLAGVGCPRGGWWALQADQAPHFSLAGFPGATLEQWRGRRGDGIPERGCWTGLAVRARSDASRPPRLTHLPPSATAVGGQGCGQSGQHQHQRSGDPAGQQRPEPHGPPGPARSVLQLRRRAATAGRDEAVSAERGRSLVLRAVGAGGGKHGSRSQLVGRGGQGGQRRLL